MNYEPDDFDDVDDDPYSCPKTDYWEKLMQKADWLRDEQKDRMLEAAWEKSYGKKLPAHQEQE